MFSGYSDKKNNSLHIFSDLACERRRADLSVPGIEFKKASESGYLWERLKITSAEAAKSIGKPIGNYDTLTLPGLPNFDEDDIEDAANEIAKELCLCIERLGINPGRLLIAGLGNRDLTPDSVGPRVAEKTNATMHIKASSPTLFDECDCSEIAVFSPGVMGTTGMESSETLTAICEKIEPDAVIAVDSLASRSAKRLGTTIQICDTGIYPGSGIGNTRHPLTIRTLGCPVIAIGVPTVINAHLLLKENEFINSLEFDDEYEMFVAPREIDVIAEISSKIISGGINQAFGIF